MCGTFLSKKRKKKKIADGDPHCGSKKEIDI